MQAASQIQFCCLLLSIFVEQVIPKRGSSSDSGSAGQANAIKDHSGETNKTAVNAAGPSEYDPILFTVGQGRYIIVALLQYLSRLC